MSKKIKPILGLATIAFLVNFLWEMLQAPLYTCYAEFLSCVWLCFRASLGDVILVLTLYGLFLWRHSRPLVVLAGILLALGIEWHALATDRWAYTENMPLIPILNVGLTPILQMAILPLLTFYLHNKWTKLQPYFLTRCLLWLGALFFLSEAFLHFFGLPILEHDRIFLFTGENGKVHISDQAGGSQYQEAQDDAEENLCRVFRRFIRFCFDQILF